MIQVSHLTKVYGSHKAVDDLSFTIESGKVYGFLGPNGAGKSTTMNILTGCLAATSGEVSVGGHDIFEEPIAAKKLIGYLPELPPLYTDMTPAEYLHFVGEAKGLHGRELKAQLKEVMEMTSIEGVKSRLIKNLSKGYRQRVGIAMALLGNPEVIILDEPTVGLDPKQIIEIRELIKTLGEKHTVILSSHILSEIREVCDEIIIISHGKLVANDTYDNLSRQLTSGRSVKLSAHADCAELLKDVPGIASVTESGVQDDLHSYTITECDDADDVPENISLRLGAAGIAVRELTPVRASLEDVFLELTESDTAPAAEADGEVPDEAAPEAGAEPDAQEEEPADTDGEGGAQA